MYGANSDSEKVRNHIVDLLIGNEIKGIKPKNPTEISKILGISRDTIYRYRNEAIRLNEIKLDSSGKPQVNKEMLEKAQFEQFKKNHKIVDDPIIQTWIESMETMGHTGKGNKSVSAHVHNIQKVCNYLKINPIQLTIDLDTSIEYASAYFRMLKSGEIPRKTLRANSNVDTAFYGIRMSIRHFMQYNKRNRIVIPRGDKSVLSGRILNHGNYSDIKLSSDEIQKAEEFIIEKYGLDSDLYRFFFVGLESCARKEALFTMSLEWTEDDETFFMIAVETKTEHLNGGKYDKFIQRKKTQESLRLAKKKGYSKLWDESQRKEKYYRQMCNMLRDVYTHLGKTHHYFKEEPFHSLRHIGAHYWLEKTNYNHGFVAEIGGWTTIDELKKSYGKIPPNIIMKQLKKAREGLNQI